MGMRRKSQQIDFSIPFYIDIILFLHKGEMP
jgi:hypothetical protein